MPVSHSFAMTPSRHLKQYADRQVLSSLQPLDASSLAKPCLQLTVLAPGFGAWTRQQVLLQSTATDAGLGLTTFDANNKQKLESCAVQHWAVKA